MRLAFRFPPTSSSSSRRFPSRVNRVIAGAAALALIMGGSSPARAGSVRVRVKDARDGAPVGGAFVQVGPAPGNPFSGNYGTTASDGFVTFSDPAISGLQTVTAAANGYARFTLIEGAGDSITIALHPEIADTTIYGPKALMTGTVQNIAMVSNDGNLDVAIVYPAVHISDLLGSGGSLPIEAPDDTVNFPIVGRTILPGNVVIPTQTEAFILKFSKPNYHFYVSDQKTYDFLAVAGRLPIASLLSPDISAAMTMREIGIERQIAVNGSRSLDINSDLNLTNNLTISMPEAPAGSEMRALSLADIIEPDGKLTIFFDNKTAIAGSTASLLLSGMNPAGDLSTAVPFIFGSYHDSSDADAWESGRLDRTPLTLPASRTIGDFFLLPDLSQTNDVFSWSNVVRAGTPDPTWCFGDFRLAPITPGDSTVTTHDLWEIVVAASRGSFALPVLSSGAPGGITDPGETPAADRLVWEHVIGDPTGTIQEIMDGGLASVTRFTRRIVDVSKPVSGVEPPQPAAARLFLGPPRPNPSDGRTEFTYTTEGAGSVRLDIFDLRGRRIRSLYSGSLPAGTHSASWNDLDSNGRRVPPGFYFARLTAAAGSVSRRIVVK